jgi:protein arginine N-methyltransferase 2
MDLEDCEVDAAIQQGSQLIQAILSFSSSDFPKIESLVKAGAPLWYQEDESGLSALLAACFIENAQIVQLLIEHGAVWNCGT